MRNIVRAALVAVALILSGCAGKDFVRPDPSRLSMGKTTKHQVLAEFGEPYRSGQALKNEQSVLSLSYAYAEAGGTPYKPGVTPARAQGFHFHNDLLVGHEFVSSWASDHTDFEHGKVSQIVRGKSTRADVVRLFGRPGGIYIYPLIKSRHGEALVYLYSEVERTGFASMKLNRKHLVVTIGAGDIVEEVEYTTTH